MFRNIKTRVELAVAQISGLQHLRIRLHCHCDQFIMVTNGDPWKGVDVWNIIFTPD